MSVKCGTNPLVDCLRDGAADLSKHGLMNRRLIDIVSADSG